MPYTATVTVNNTVLPDQHLYQAGDTVTLSDADYAAMGSTLRAAVLSGITGAAGTATATATGLPGAANAVRMVGGNASGAPTTGTFNVRDEVIDADGTVWVCTVAGTPGTWVQAVGSGITFGAVVSQTTFGAASASGTGTTVAHSEHTHGTPAAPTPGSIGAVATSAVGAASGVASLDSSSKVVQAGSAGAWTAAGVSTGTALAASGLTGAASAARLVGGGASGAPTTGAFSARDVVVNTDGSIYVCTAGGTPGTWTQIGGSGGASASWTTYAPTLASGTLGNGALYGSYTKSGTDCTVRVTLLWGSTTSIAGAISINLPFTAATVTGPAVSAPKMWVGSAQAWIAAANNRAGVTVIDNGGTTLQATSDNIPSLWTATTPVTIAANDHLVFEVTYETV